MQFFDKDITQILRQILQIEKAQILLITTRWWSLPEILAQHLIVIISISSDLSSRKTFSPIIFAQACRTANKHTNGSHTSFGGRELHRHKEKPKQM